RSTLISLLRKLIGFLYSIVKSSGEGLAIKFLSGELFLSYRHPVTGVNRASLQENEEDKLKTYEKIFEEKRERRDRGGEQKKQNGFKKFRAEIIEVKREIAEKKKE
ncbi:hypothetical protein K0M31_002238, partial [Melipona bicolor]